MTPKDLPNTVLKAKAAFKVFMRDLSPNNESTDPDFVVGFVKGYEQALKDTAYTFRATADFSELTEAIDKIKKNLNDG